MFINIFTGIQDASVLGQAVNTLKSLIGIKVQLLNSPKMVDFLLRFLEDKNLSDKINEVKAKNITRAFVMRGINNIY